MRLDCRANQMTKDTAAAKADVFLQAIATKTPAQIDAYIEQQVTDLPSAKRVLKMLCKAVSLIVKRGLI